MMSVVIPVFNKSELTQRCLESILTNSRQTHEVVVINNASQDNTAEVLSAFSSTFQKHHISFQVITNDKNLGFGRACNQGIRLTTGDWVSVLNNDTWLMPNWDGALIKAAQVNQLDIVCPYYDEKSISNSMELRAQAFVERNQNKIRHHFMAILFTLSRKAVEHLQFEHGGIFDERFFVTYEDTDLLHRAKALNLNYAQTGSCYIWHHSMGTRSTPGLLPTGYEAEGLKLFIEKWSFDPRPQDHTLIAKLRRWWWKTKEKWGSF